MLAIVVEKERSDLEAQRNNLIITNAKYQVLHNALSHNILTMAYLS